MPANASFAAALVRRLALVLRRYGQEVRLRRGGSVFPFMARVAILSTATRYTWFRRDESDDWESPAWSVTIAGDFTTTNGGPLPGDIVEIPAPNNGTLDHTIRKIDKPRLGGVVVKTVLYVARDLP